MQGFEPPFWTSDEISEHNGFPRYPDSEMTRRHSWLDSLIADEAFDVVVVGGATGPLETSVQYFTNWPPQVPSYLVVTPGEAPILFVRLWNHLPDAQRISTIEYIRYGGDTPCLGPPRGTRFPSLATSRGPSRRNSIRPLTSGTRG